MKTSAASRLSIIVKATLAFIFILLAHLEVSAKSNSNSPKASSQVSAQEQQILKFDLLKALLENVGLSLKGRSSCDIFVQSNHDTVGKFIAWSLSFYDEGQANRIHGACEKIKTSKNCTVYF